MRNCQPPLLSLLLCMLLLAGCGQTGPLYLPEPLPESPQDPAETDTRPAPAT